MNDSGGESGRRPRPEWRCALGLFIAVALLSGCAKAKPAADTGAEGEPGVMERVEQQQASDTEVFVDQMEQILSGPEILLADTFNKGEKPNRLGGNYGAWNRDPLDPSQGCREEYSLDNHGPGRGYSVKLTYDVESKNPAYNGFWMKLNEVNLTGYKELHFFMKGDTSAGFTTRLKVELKNNIVGERAEVVVENITADWTHYRIPLSQFATLEDWTKISEFVIVFDDELAIKKTGAIYIDDIYFTR